MSGLSSCNTSNVPGRGLSPWKLSLVMGGLSSLVVNKSLRARAVSLETKSPDGRAVSLETKSLMMGGLSPFVVNKSLRAVAVSLQCD